jgi:non-ribosomal peptide synthetase component E (peptide arylation enzyme)
LDERSSVIAAGLRERGVGKGERVAVSLGNCWEFAVVTYSLFKLGAILVSPVSYFLMLGTKRDQIADKI